MNANEANRKLAKPPYGDRVIPILKALPPGTNPRLAAAATLDLFSAIPWKLCRFAQALPDDVVQLVLRKLDDEHAEAPFLRALTRDDDVKTTWADALEGVAALNTTYAWGSKKHLEKLRSVVKRRDWLEAVQVAVVATKAPREDFLGVLALDGSEASVDALLPHFDAAMKAGDEGLDQLAKLKKYAAATPAMKALVTSAETARSKRNTTSPALGFAQLLGLGDLKAFSWGQFVRVADAKKREVELSLDVDSKSGPWFSVHVARATEHPKYRLEVTAFNSSRKAERDELKLGRCEPHGLPAFVARVQRKLGVNWKLAKTTPFTNVKGDKAKRLTAWLSGG